MRAKMILNRTKTEWATPFRPVTSFRFELYVKKLMRCYLCGVKVFDCEHALLKDNSPGIRNKKIECLHGLRGSFWVKDPAIMCVSCFNTGRGLCGRDVHHRIIIKLINPQLKI